MDEVGVVDVIDECVGVGRKRGVGERAEAERNKGVVGRLGGGMSVGGEIGRAHV